MSGISERLLELARQRRPKGQSWWTTVINADNRLAARCNICDELITTWAAAWGARPRHVERALLTHWKRHLAQPPLLQGGRQ